MGVLRFLLDMHCCFWQRGSTKNLIKREREAEGGRESEKERREREREQRSTENAETALSEHRESAKRA